MWIRSTRTSLEHLGTVFRECLELSNFDHVPEQITVPKYVFPESVWFPLCCPIVSIVFPSQNSKKCDESFEGNFISKKFIPSGKSSVKSLPIAEADEMNVTLSVESSLGDPSTALD